VIATSEEIGDAIEVTSLSWHRGTGGTPTSSFTDFNIYLGYCPNETLGTNFADNYSPGSRTLVHHSDNITVAEGTEEWFSIDLDTPFWYNGAENLILEVTWASGAGSVNNYLFTTPMTPVNLKSAIPDGETGFLSSIRCQFMLLGMQQLENGTFASVKVILGN